MQHVATRSVNKLTSRLLQIVLDLCGGSNVGQTGQTRDRWRKPRKFRQAFRSSERKVFTRCCTNPREFEMRFLQTLLWGRFYRRLRLSFDQPSCMRCNEHNQQQSRLHSRLMQLSQRRRTLQRTGSTAKASKCFGAVISSPEPPKETVLRCTMHAAVQTNPRKLVLFLRTRSLFHFHIGVRLGRKPQ